MTILFNSPINKMSYGYTGYYLFLELIKLYPSLYLFPIGQIEKDMYNDVLPYLFGGKDFNPDKNSVSIKLWHQYDVHTRPFNCKHVGYTIFELDDFTKQEKESMKLCDEMITCSKWGADLITQKTGVKCSVVPLGINPDIFRPANLSQKNSTIFFNGGKWEKRKGHDVLIECFNKAFEKDDDVELWMMPSNPFLSELQTKEWESLIKNSKLCEKIKILPRQNSQNNVYNIMSRADIGVFPSHAEGWNLELLEMMAIGKHVIATDYSAHTEFCNAENSSLIKITEKEPAFDGIWFKNQGKWAKFDDLYKESLIFEMRKFHNMKQSQNLGINYSGIETGKIYTWANSARKLLELIL